MIGANDFASPSTSNILSELAAIPILSDKITRFSAICAGDYASIPALSDFLNPSYRIRLDVPSPVKKVGYISTYPVLDARDYELCLKHVGDMVELVGKVVDVASGKTYLGDPYIFINFSDWRGKAVKISIWSDYLNNATDTDFWRLKGKYISVIGLMQPPYHSFQYNYTHLSINLDNTINETDEKEARYRLNYENDPLPGWPRDNLQEGNRKKSNKEKVNSHISSHANGKRQSETPESLTGKQSSNQAILNAIRQRAGSAATQPAQASVNSAPSFSVNTFTGQLAPCPYCHALNPVGCAGIQTVRCKYCMGEFTYSHYTCSVQRKGAPGQADAANKTSTHKPGAAPANSVTAPRAFARQTSEKPPSGCMGILAAFVWLVMIIWLAT